MHVAAWITPGLRQRLPKQAAGGGGLDDPAHTISRDDVAIACHGDGVRHELWDGSGRVAEQARTGIERDVGAAESVLREVDLAALLAPSQKRNCVVVAIVGTRARARMIPEF